VTGGEEGAVTGEGLVAGADGAGRSAGDAVA
jgi:hypothetical protein